MKNWHRGDLIVFDGSLAVVVGIPDDPNVPEEHVAIWYGEPQDGVSEDGTSRERPKVYTVPAEYCHLGPEPVYLH